MRTRLLQLFETVDEDEERSAFGEWLNAEGQLCLHRAITSLDALSALKDRSGADAIFKANEPFHRWVAEFSHNIHFWRTGNMDEVTM